MKAMNESRVPSILWWPSRAAWLNSGSERHLHTVQYVATETIYDWPYLRDKFPGVHESGANITNNVWFHARLEIANTIVRVFVDDGKEPVLVVKDLKLGDRSEAEDKSNAKSKP